jgi:hypothetical protein
MFLVAYESLGKVLAGLAEQPEIKSSPELLDRIQNAVKFHQQMQDYFQPLVNEYISTAKKLAEISRDPNAITSADDFSLIGKYAQIRDAGADATVIYRVAKSDGVVGTMHYRILRKLFGFSWDEARIFIEKIEEDQNNL